MNFKNLYIKIIVKINYNLGYTLGKIISKIIFDLQEENNNLKKSLKQAE